MTTRVAPSSRGGSDPTSHGSLPLVSPEGKSPRAYEPFPPTRVVTSASYEKLALTGQHGLTPEAHCVPVIGTLRKVPAANDGSAVLARTSHRRVADFTVAPEGIPVIEIVPRPRLRIPIPAAV